jgi:CheY-like chemotaxis protein
MSKVNQPRVQPLKFICHSMKGKARQTRLRPAHRCRRVPARQSGSIDLLLTDVVMPDMNGYELAKHLETVRPNIKALYTSGYTDDIFTRQNIPDKDLHFLPKPFSKKELAVKIREIIV